MSDVFGPRELLLGDPGQQDARGVGDPFLVLTDRHQGVVGDLAHDLVCQGGQARGDLFAGVGDPAPDVRCERFEVRGVRGHE
jgi:hypothetical protein